MKRKNIDVSVIVPMFNEEQNVSGTLDRIIRALDSIPRNWEIIVVDDGSTDKTKKMVEDYSRYHRWVRLISYPQNRGRGKALRVGFTHARGAIICTTDADLSYDEKHILQMIEVLDKNPDLDLVVGSPYAPGGKAQGIPFFRLFLSKWGNKILGFAMKGGVSTVTGVLKGISPRMYPFPGTGIGWQGDTSGGPIQSPGHGLQIPRTPRYLEIPGEREI